MFFTIILLKWWTKNLALFDSSRIGICRGLSDLGTTQSPRLWHLLLALAVPTALGEPLGIRVPGFGVGGCHYLTVKGRNLSRAPRDAASLQVIRATAWGEDVEAAFI